MREALIFKYVNELEETRAETRANVERKQTLTDRERDVFISVLTVLDGSGGRGCCRKSSC